jgi:hypothetical protein
MYHDRFREVLRREVSPRRALKRPEASTNRSRLVLRVLKKGSNNRGEQNGA